MRRLIDLRRMAIAVPVLIGVGIGVYVLAGEGTDASTPRAVLADTPVSGDATVGVRKGQAARDFIGTSPDGDRVRLSELRGRPVIINFWATWCASCLAEMPDLRDVQAEFGADNLYVLAVNSGEGSGAAREFLDVLDAPDFLPVMDPTLAVSDAYGVSGLSTSVFVDAHGVIRATYIGQLSKKQIREYAQAASEGYDAADPPPRLRLPGTVQARRSVIEVSDAGHGRATFRSRMLRCDDTHCADVALATLAGFRGVLAIGRHVDEDPPRIEVTYEPQVIDLDTLAEALADIVSKGGDPLYESYPEIERR